ncbi:MAG: anti-sigma factor antagonist, partial [Calditrichaeota bacterium]
NGGVLKLAGATNTVQNLLAITKLDTIFETYDSTEAALNSFA